uniref:DUF725 domain-containing protein n=1 Tax=Panagrellus redivivus TaxID=6233 RepID=A0A7E4VRN0_PANRE
MRTTLFVFGVFAVVEVFCGVADNLLPPPTFLNGLNLTAVQSFNSTAFSQNLSWNQKVEQLQQWASSQPPDIQTALSTWEQNTVYNFTVLIAQADDAVINISAMARTLYNQIRAVAIDNTLSGFDQCSQITSDITNFDQKAFNELEQSVPLVATVVASCSYGQEL